MKAGSDSTKDTTGSVSTNSEKTTGVDRYLRTPAEKMLLRWVLAWLILAMVATAVLLVFLLQLNKYRVVDDKLKVTLELQRRLTRKVYSKSDEVSRMIINETSSDKIKDTLRSLVREASSGQQKVLDYVKNMWTSHGMDHTDLFTYGVLMSLPDPNNENKVELYKDGVSSFTATNQEVPVPETQMSNGPPFYAYAAAGDVKEAYIYVNYGRMSDLNYLENRGIAVQGKIFVGRLGKIMPAKKAQNAEKAGAAALVLFMDPKDVGPRGNGQGPFPDSWWVGGSALHRGSVAYVGGDPSTPGYPSRAGFYKVPTDNAMLPKIPCQPIGYDDARTILGELNSNACPDKWKPQLSIPCNIDSSSDLQLRVAVYNKLQSTTITNIVATINGSKEADRLVMVGHHLDSVTKISASDPLLGISQLLEVTRVFGHLLSKGWRPERTLVFSLWDGEEQGMLGSTEWVEDHMASLRSRAVLYIGTDVLSGDRFRPRSSPAIAASIRRTASITPHHKDMALTLLDSWSADPTAKKNTQTQPLSWPIVGRSDDAAFVFSAGVSTAFMHFTQRPGKAFPAHHTGYDTYEMVEKYVDPGFLVSRMSAQMMAGLARQWADRSLLPYELRELSYEIRVGLDTFFSKHKNTINSLQLDLSAPFKAASEFIHATERFMNLTKHLDLLNPIMIRVANDIMMKIEKIFICPGGIPSRDITLRNLVYSPDGVMFPGMQDAIMRNPVDVDAFGRQVALLTEVLCQASRHLLLSPV
ncbi:N-acetylated-alpha-linked acidic dipeptidase 2-like [Ornithodoros turicata]|uniref:N-acetylated-alpha-linked acidic dipeptidase 2-like n=1 Tax=Ornithodoros turicata TaxID=34597 RepID=UPI003139447C